MRGTSFFVASVIVLLLAGCGSDAELPDADMHAEHSTPEAAAAMAAHEHDHPPELTATAGPGFTAADVEFMQMMIVHHAQALTMAELAPTHGVGSAVLALAQKIEISQEDEILQMERWLRDRGQPVPDEGHRETMHMAGMLTPEQLAELDAARGEAFDRLFLTFMIQHHLGAVDMVDALFASPGAGQDSDIFRFATDVGSDQLDEIGVMESLLDRMSAPLRE